MNYLNAKHYNRQQKGPFGPGKFGKAYTEMNMRNLSTAVTPEEYRRDFI